jgi:O-succinylbenzoic acid--CoA ligase
LSDARIVDGLISESDNDLRRWDAHHFLRICTKTGGTLTALVPTQVYDLIQAKLQAPASLRAIVVGGAALSESIYFEALNLGWPLLPSYGMTECCSQIATASLESLSANPRRFPEPELLSHVEVSQNDAGKIRVRSPSLLTGFAILSPGGDRWIDPKTDGWFQSEDMGEVLETAQGVFLKVRGRTSDFVKIGGESVDLNRLSGILSELRAKAATSLDLVVIDVSDERLGKVIHGVAAAEVGSADATMAQTIFDQFNARVLPFERVRKIHIVTEIPRSPLQKLLKPQLLAQLS